MGKKTASLNIDQLAEQIATLAHTQQEALFREVAELSFQHELKTLARQYQGRLAQAGKLNQRAEEVLAELEQIRKEIAAHDYRA